MSKRFLLVFILLASGLAHGHGLVLPLTLTDLVRQSEAIVVADLIDARSRWNERGNLIVTDFRFRPVQIVRGAPDADFTLTQAGGSVQGEHHAISDAAVLQVGRRYLLFVSSLTDAAFTPFVGAAQGVVIQAADGSAQSLPGVEGRSLPARFGELVEQVERMAVDRPYERPAPRAEHSYPAARYEPQRLPPPSSTQAPMTPPPIAGAPPASETPTAIDTTVLDDGRTSPSRYFWQRPPTLPIVFNPLPLDWAWSPHDQYQMSKWNYHGGTVFQVMAPTGTWAWQNDRYDLAGFPDNQTMINQFGAGWGVNTLGITWLRWFDNGPIVESDVALNPAFCWTLDEEFGTREGSTCWSFQQTMLHELGHAWGLAHPWEHQDVWWESVMNYAPKEYRVSKLHADDVAGIRNAYGGIGRHDFGVYLYRTADTVGNNHPTYFATQPFERRVRHGENLILQDAYVIENVGTTQLVNPATEIWLSENRMNWDGVEYYLGTTTASGSWGPYTYLSVTAAATPVAATVPTGRYFLALYLPAADDDAGNNSDWGNQNNQIVVENVEEILTPQSYVQYSTTGSIGPDGRWRFRFMGQAGQTYVFSTCASDGGYANFDTTLTLSALGTVLVSNDDACADFHSRLVYTSNWTGPFDLDVAGYSRASQGQFYLVYRHDGNLIFAAGFDG